MLAGWICSLPRYARSLGRWLVCSLAGNVRWLDILALAYWICSLAGYATSGCQMPDLLDVPDVLEAEISSFQRLPKTLSKTAVLSQF